MLLSQLAVGDVSRASHTLNLALGASPRIRRLREHRHHSKDGVFTAGGSEACIEMHFVRWGGRLVNGMASLQKQMGDGGKTNGCVTMHDQSLVEQSGLHRCWLERRESSCSCTCWRYVAPQGSEHSTCGLAIRTLRRPRHNTRARFQHALMA